VNGEQMTEISRIFKPRRELGKTGWMATVLGVGDLADRALPIEDCVATARRALEAGLNVIDTAPGYEDGYSEQIVGRAVTGRREEVFVITKIDHPDQPVAGQVQASLERLGMKFADCFLFHGVSEMAVWQHIAAPGGPMDELEACVREGRGRFRGISSHHPDVLRAALESGRCDVVMFAAGPFGDARFVNEILPLARRKGVGTVCFKTFGAGKLLGDTDGYGRPLQARPRGKPESGGGDAAGAPSLPALTVEECVRYTLTCDPDVALLGLSFPSEQDAAFAAARAFRPLSGAEMDDIRRRAARAVEGKGPCWWTP
jgi:aryl-alcohol dehydrogenase-like predicted oxidoreductase